MIVAAVVAMRMPVRVAVVVAMLASVAVLPFPAMQIGHVVVVVLVGRIKHHGKIAHVQTRLRHAADLHGEALHRQAVQGTAHGLLAGAGIQQGRGAHVAADARGAFQIKQ